MPSSDPDMDYQRGPGRSPVEIPEHIKEPETSPCFGCAKHITDEETRIRHAKKHPVCTDCYMRGDYTHMSCTECGVLKRRTAPGKTEFTCHHHQEEITP